MLWPTKIFIFSCSYCNFTIFNFILFVHTGQANFHFTRCSIFTECCCWPWKRFEWSKLVLLKFQPPYKLNLTSKISHPPCTEGESPLAQFGKPWSEACRDMHWVMVLVQSTQHNFPFKFYFWYVDRSWYRLLHLLVTSRSPNLLHQVSTQMVGAAFPHPLRCLCKILIFDRAHPNNFWSAFNICEIVPACKKSISSFLRYNQFQSP